MTTFPKGYKVLVRDPNNELIRRLALVVREATQGVDEFVCVKYPGRPDVPDEFEVGWSEISETYSSKLGKPVPPKIIPASEVIVISDDEEPINFPMLETKPPPVRASKPRKAPIPFQGRSHQERKNVTATFGGFTDESRVIPDSDVGDDHQMQVDHCYGASRDGDVFHVNAPRGHIIDQYRDRVAHPANPWRSYSTREDYRHDSSRRYDERYDQDHYRPRMTRDHGYNGVSSDALKQHDVNEQWHGHSVYSRSDYMETRSNAPASQIPRTKHQNDYGCSSGLRGDRLNSAHLGDHLRSERQSFGGRRPSYFRDEPAASDNDTNLPSRHQDLTKLSVPVSRPKRRISEERYPTVTNGGETAVQAVREDRPSQSPNHTSPPASFAHANPIHQQTSTKRIRVKDDFEDRNQSDALNVSKIAQNMRRPVQSNEPPLIAAMTDLSSQKKSPQNEACSRPPLHTLPDIAPSFVASNPFTSTNENEMDKNMSELLRNIILGDKTLNSLDIPDARGGDPKPERFPSCPRKKSTPVKRQLTGSIEEAPFYFRRRNDSSSKVFIADVDTALSNGSGEEIRLHSCLCGLAEEPEFEGPCGSIQCGMCGLWSHLRCTQMLEEEIEQYKNRERRFMCWTCLDDVMFYGLRIGEDQNPKWGIQIRPVLPIFNSTGNGLVNNQLSRRKRKSIRKSLTEDERKARADNIEALRQGLPRWSVGTRERNVVDKAVAREAVGPLLP